MLSSDGVETEAEYDQSSNGEGSSEDVLSASSHSESSSTALEPRSGLLIGEVEQFRGLYSWFVFQFVVKFLRIGDYERNLGLGA